MCNVKKIGLLEEKRSSSFSNPDSVDDKEKHLEVSTSRWNIERGENRCFIDKGVLVRDSRALVTLKLFYANFRCEMMHNSTMHYKSRSEATTKFEA